MTALKEVIRYSAKPILVMSGLLLGTSALAGLAGRDLATALSAGGWGLLTGATSLWSHESAHLFLARRLGGTGRVVSTWTRVSIAAPELSPGVSLVVALAGPLAGATTCLLLVALGLPHWIGLVFAVVHLSNLLPWAGSDGQHVMAASARLLLRRLGDAGPDTERVPLVGSGTPGVKGDDHP